MAESMAVICKKVSCARQVLPFNALEPEDSIAAAAAAPGAAEAENPRNNNNHKTTKATKATKAKSKFTRTALISIILEEFGFKRYLEIGCRNDDNFAPVQKFGLDVAVKQKSKSSYTKENHVLCILIYV